MTLSNISSMKALCRLMEAEQSATNPGSSPASQTLASSGGQFSPHSSETTSAFPAGWKANRRLEVGHLHLTDSGMQTRVCPGCAGRDLLLVQSPSTQVRAWHLHIHCRYSIVWKPSKCRCAFCEQPLPIVRRSQSKQTSFCGTQVQIITLSTLSWSVFLRH